MSLSKTSTSAAALGRYQRFEKHKEVLKKKSYQYCFNKSKKSVPFALMSAIGIVEPFEAVRIFLIFSLTASKVRPGRDGIHEGFFGVVVAKTLPPLVSMIVF
jgi:hypothetical protein